MRRELTAAAVLSIATVSTGFAADGVVPPAPQAAGAVETTATVTAESIQGDDTVVRGQSNRAYVRSQRRGGFFARLMEAERRKNEWLRRTFLNR